MDLGMETVALCHQQMQERKATEYVAKNEKKRKQAKHKKVVIGVLMAAFFIAALKIVGDNDLESEGIVLAKETETIQAEVQKYIVKYGTSENNGNKMVTEDGHEWNLIDAPEIPTGTEVRILFESNGTLDPDDDVIIDITER